MMCLQEPEGQPRSPVTCETCSGEELALRLVGGEVMPETAFGMPEIFHSGGWGSFCNGDIYRFLEYQFFISRPYTQVRPLPKISNGSAARVPRVSMLHGERNRGLASQQKET